MKLKKAARSCSYRCSGPPRAARSPHFIFLKWELKSGGKTSPYPQAVMKYFFPSFLLLFIVCWSILGLAWAFQHTIIVLCGRMLMTTTPAMSKSTAVVDRLQSDRNNPQSVAVRDILHSAVVVNSLLCSECQGDSSDRLPPLKVVQRLLTASDFATGARRKMCIASLFPGWKLYSLSGARKRFSGVMGNFLSAN